jgi:membrane fusion protein (multidrug efflux system)
MRRFTPCILWLGVMLAGCQAPPPPAAPPPVVKVATPTIADTDIVREFVGAVAATSEVEIRSKVTGIVSAQEFREGQPVAEGQVLFRLSAESLRAGSDNARSQVRNAQAALDKTSADVARYQPLAEKGTIPRQTLDQAITARDQARAGLASARALLEQAEIAQQDAVIRAPYAGRIGRAQVQIGALVQAGQTVLATVSTTDAARVDFALSEREYLELVRPILETRTQAEPSPVELRLADGSTYPHKGRIGFADRALSETTGTFAVAADFPNPDEVLRPGMFGHVRAIVQRRPGAMLVPQRAVQQLLDRSFVSVVRADGKVERKAVVMGPRVGADWIVESGLDAGDRVIVEGHHRVRPGQVVDAQPLEAPAAAPAAAG